MPPTQKELARLAGVSSGTVSNVISGAAGVSDRSRQKVLDAIRTLNYKPNLIARSLRTNRTHTLGMVIPDITVPFFSKVIRGAEAAAREAGYFLSVLDCESSPDREAAMLDLLRSQRVEGLLLITAGGHAQPQAGVPIVYLDRLPEGLAVDSVCVDDCASARLAVTHLTSLGHTHIAVITGPMTLQNEQERLHGYRLALRAAGLPARQDLIWKASFEHTDVERLLRSGLKDPATRPSALFATNGVTGLAALKSLYAMKLSTPADIACVTFDELTSEDFFRPAITSVVQPAFDIGSRAVAVLLERIERVAFTHSSLLHRIRLPATLIVRESSHLPRPAPAPRTPSPPRKPVARRR